MITHLDAAVTAALVWPALSVAHRVGDRWLQTDTQAMDKGKPGLVGWLAAGRHVATYTAGTAAFVGAVWALFGLPITLAGFFAGQAVSALTHVVIDRRWTLRWVVEHVAPWNRTYYDDVPCGAEHLDQSAHFLCLLGATIATALI